MGDVELHVSDLMSAEDRPDPATPEIHVTFNVRFLPALSAEMRMHLASSPQDEELGDENTDRQEPAFVVPTRTSSISSRLSQVVSR